VRETRRMSGRRSERGVELLPDEGFEIPLEAPESVHAALARTRHCTQRSSGVVPEEKFKSHRHDLLQAGSVLSERVGVLSGHDLLRRDHGDRADVGYPD
jgi:hypothetical protein